MIGDPRESTCLDCGGVPFELCCDGCLEGAHGPDCSRAGTFKGRAASEQPNVPEQELVAAVAAAFMELE